MTDYRQLCIDLFGTDDEGEIRRIVGQKNVRNAGRKKKFTQQDIDDMTNLRSHGVTIKSIAESYGTSRQIVSKYLNSKPDQGYTMRMVYMHNATPCSDIDINFLDKTIKVRNYTDDLLHRAFGVLANPTWDDFEDFMRYRCFPETRGDAKQLLKQLGIDNYDPLQIIEKTCGKIADDNMWIKVKYYERENTGL